MYSRPSPFHTVTIGSHASTNIRPAPSSPRLPDDRRWTFADRRSLATPKRKARRLDHRLSTLAYRPLTSSLLTPPCSLSLKPSAASPQPPSLSLLIVRPALARSSSPEPCMSIAIAPTLP